RPASARSPTSRWAVDIGSAARRAMSDADCRARPLSKVSRMRTTRSTIESPEREFAMPTAYGRPPFRGGNARFAEDRGCPRGHFRRTVRTDAALRGDASGMVRGDMTMKRTLFLGTVFTTVMVLVLPFVGG